jgi:hypothetical protein
MDRPQAGGYNIYENALENSRLPLPKANGGGYFVGASFFCG